MEYDFSLDSTNEALLKQRNNIECDSIGILLIAFICLRWLRRWLVMSPTLQQQKRVWTRNFRSLYAWRIWKSHCRRLKRLQNLLLSQDLYIFSFSSFVFVFVCKFNEKRIYSDFHVIRNMVANRDRGGSIRTQSVFEACGEIGDSVSGFEWEKIWGK